MKKLLKEFFWGDFDATIEDLNSGRKTPKLYIFCLLLVISICSFIFQWEMSVVFGINLNYLMAFSTLCSTTSIVLFCLANDNPISRALFHTNRMVLNGIFGIAVVGQIMHWIGLITLPIF